MENLMDLNQNPELAAWLEGLKAKVESKSDKTKNEGSAKEPSIYLPRINMGDKFSQSNGKTYPEMQGTMTLLPVPYKGQRVTEISNVYKCWCPSDDQWNSGFMYRLLPEEYYPEGEIRTRMRNCRVKLAAMLKSGKLTWKECKRQNFSLILALVISHRNTKNDIVSSKLYGGDQLVEHKYIPAVVICPNNMVQAAIKNDLDMKPNPVPYAMACYSDVPLKERKGWMSLKFTDKVKGFGYDVSVGTELVNPVVMPEGLFKPDFNFEDERIKLLYTTDPVKSLLDWRQLGTNGEYYNVESIDRLEKFISYLESK